MFRTLVSVASGFGLLAGVAIAQTAWRSETLDGGAVIDVPAAATDLPHPSEYQLMNISLIKGSTQLVCALIHRGYEVLSREKLTTAFGNKASHDALCQKILKDDGATDFRLVSSSTGTTSDGHPTGTCVARQTAPGSLLLPVEIDTTEFVLGGKTPYMLFCAVRATNADDAQAAYDGGNADMIAHMQQSLRLPATEAANAQ